MSAAYRLFSQQALDAAALVRGAQGIARGLKPPLELDIQEVHPRLALADAAAEEPLWLTLRAARGDVSASYRLLERFPTEEDWAAAKRAEVASQAHGMAGLARRCPRLWEVHPSPAEADLALTLLLCAVAAGVALGPVLPADESALFGVRGARLRAGV